MRYAIYYMPGMETSLGAFGAAVLGYDAASGADVTFKQVPDFPEPSLASATERPRRYGFHATLKAPFALRRAHDEAALIRGVEALAAHLQPCPLPDLQVAKLGRFLALVPTQPSQLLNGLAAQCVEKLDPFRAPMSPDEWARRTATPLSDQHIALLKRWGYPYVFEAFRFHMTLTGPLSEPELPKLYDSLRTAFSNVTQPQAIDALTIACQDTPASRFRVLKRIPLGT